jgi:zinc protease
MDLLLAILAEGDSSRLHRALVEDEALLLSVGGAQTDGFDPGLVYFYLTVTPGGDLAQTEERFLEELRRVVEDGITEDELQKARNLRLAAFWRGLQTIDGKASSLGNFHVFTGDYENLFSIPEQISNITPADLQAVAARVFRDGNLTVGILRSPDEGEAE